MECPRCRLLNPPEALRCDCGWDFETHTMQPSYVSRSAMTDAPLASLQDRFVGQVLDTGVVFGMLVAGGVLSSAAGATSWVQGLTFLSILGYLLFADALKGGQSLGKRVVNSAVVDATSGAPCSIGQSFVRNLPLLFLAIFDWGFIFRGRQQRLGDRLANTIVISLAAPSMSTEPAGPPLSDDEIVRTRALYAQLSTNRLEELLASPADLRPGAEALLSEELDRRRDTVRPHRTRAGLGAR